MGSVTLWHPQASCLSSLEFLQLYTGGGNNSCLFVFRKQSRHYYTSLRVYVEIVPTHLAFWPTVKERKKLIATPLIYERAVCVVYVHIYLLVQSVVYTELIITVE